MADWPNLAMLKQALAVDRSDKDDLLQQALDTAIEGVQIDVGVPVDDPPAKLAQAALHRAVTVYKGPDAPFGVAGIFDTGGIYVSKNDPIYMWLLKGNKQRFGIS